MLTSAACDQPPNGPSPTPAVLPSPSPAAVVISSLDPSIGLASETNYFVLSGRGFQPGATVLVAGVATTAVRMNDATIRVWALAHEVGEFDDVVTNPSGTTARLERGYTYVATVPGDLRIRPGESVSSTLEQPPLWCTFESAPCRAVYVDAGASEMVELELTSESPFIGLYVTAPFLSPIEYPRRLTIAGRTRLYVIGDQKPFTLTARLR